MLLALLPRKLKQNLFAGIYFYATLKLKASLIKKELSYNKQRRVLKAKLNFISG